MARLYAVEVEPEVRSWLERLSDRDFGRTDFLVGLLAEQAEILGEPCTLHLGGKSASCSSACWLSRPALPTGSRPDAGSSFSPYSARAAAPKSFRKSRSAEVAEVARALQAQKTCETEHGPAHDTFDREAP